MNAVKAGVLCILVLAGFSGIAIGDEDPVVEAYQLTQKALELLDRSNAILDAFDPVLMYQGEIINGEVHGQILQELERDGEQIAYIRRGVLIHECRLTTDPLLDVLSNISGWATGAIVGAVVPEKLSAIPFALAAKKLAEEAVDALTGNEPEWRSTGSPPTLPASIDVPGPGDDQLRGRTDSESVVLYNLDEFRYYHEPSPEPLREDALTAWVNRSEVTLFGSDEAPPLQVADHRPFFEEEEGSEAKDDDSSTDEENAEDTQTSDEVSEEDQQSTSSDGHSNQSTQDSEGPENGGSGSSTMDEGPSKFTPISAAPSVGIVADASELAFVTGGQVDSTLAAHAEPDLQAETLAQAEAEALARAEEEAREQARLQAEARAAEQAQRQARAQARAEARARAQARAQARAEARERAQARSRSTSSSRSTSRTSRSSSYTSQPRTNSRYASRWVM